MRVIFTIFIILSFVFSSFSQETGKVEERAEVYLVVVPVIVLDKEGNFVEGLKKEDFEGAPHIPQLLSLSLKCPKCGSSATKIIGGRECTVKNIQILTV